MAGGNRLLFTVWVVKTQVYCKSDNTIYLKLFISTVKKLMNTQMEGEN